MNEFTFLEQTCLEMSIEYQLNIRISTKNLLLINTGGSRYSAAFVQSSNFSTIPNSH